MGELTTGSAVIARFGDSSWTVATVSAFVASAESLIARYCGRFDLGGNNWLTHTRTEFRNGEYADMADLKWVPVTAVSAATIVYASGSTQSLTLTDLTMDGIEIASLSASNAGLDGFLYMRSNPDLLWSSENVYGLARTPNYGGGKKRVKVEYTGGYANAAAIPDVVMAVQLTAANMYRNRTRDLAVTSTTLGNFSETYGNSNSVQNANMLAQWLGDQISLLQDHKRIGV